MEKALDGLELIEQYFSDFTPQQQQQFRQLAAVYTEWNEKINVISRKDIDSLYLKHVLHSLAIAATHHFEPGTRVLDIGTGGGFPGVPLAIFFPEVEFFLVDSIGKKLKVVEAVKAELNLQNITVQHTRTEDIKGRKFDFAVSRAVAPLANLWQWSNKLIIKAHKQEVPNGLFCLKGGDLTQEIFESGLRPTLQSISTIFKEPFFEEKFVVYVPK